MPHNDPHHQHDPRSSPHGDPDSHDVSGLVKLTEAQDGSAGLRIGARLRNYFLTGLIVVGPVSITIYIVWWFVNLVDAWMQPILPRIGDIISRLPLPFTLPPLPGLGLIVGIVLLMLIGALTANLFGRTIISFGEMMLARMPIIRNVYSALKQIFETVLTQSDKTFRQVGMIEYPRKGVYSLVFISTETRGEIQARNPQQEKMLSVFLPTTPNPTSGFLLFVPKKEVTVLNMTVEEAARMVISAGLVVPPYDGPPAGALTGRDAAAALPKRPPEPAETSSV